jgi:hypothetical protein
MFSTNVVLYIFRRRTFIVTFLRNNFYNIAVLNKFLPNVVSVQENCCNAVLNQICMLWQAYCEKRYRLTIESVALFPANVFLNMKDAYVCWYQYGCFWLLCFRSHLSFSPCIWSHSSCGSRPAVPSIFGASSFFNSYVKMNFRIVINVSYIPCRNILSHLWRLRGSRFSIVHHYAEITNMISMSTGL